MPYHSPFRTFIRLPHLSFNFPVPPLSFCLSLPSPYTQSNSYPTVDLPPSQLDYEALCRYTVRMGRSFNSVVQEMRVTDEKTYALLKEGLKRDLLAMMDASNGCVSRLLLCIPIFVSLSVLTLLFCSSTYSTFLLLPFTSLLSHFCTFFDEPLIKLHAVLVFCALTFPCLISLFTNTSYFTASHHIT